MKELLKKVLLKKENLLAYSNVTAAYIKNEYFITVYSGNIADIYFRLG